MAKIRSLEALDRGIDAEIVWRKRELTTALTVIQQSSGPAQKANLRSGLLILYAHWEGWVKAVARLYIRYVNTMSIPYDGLSEAFLGNALKTRLGAIDEAMAARKHTEFAVFLRTEMSKGATLSESLIRSESNLSSKLFFEVLERLGLDRRPEFSLRANLIDSELLEKRNSIAHGEFLDLTKDRYAELRSSVLELLELFTDDVRNAAATRSYMARDVPQ